MLLHLHLSDCSGCLAPCPCPCPSRIPPSLSLLVFYPLCFLSTVSLVGFSSLNLASPVKLECGQGSLPMFFCFLQLSPSLITIHMVLRHRTQPIFHTHLPNGCLPLGCSTDPTIKLSTTKAGSTIFPYEYVLICPTSMDIP